MEPSGWLTTKRRALEGEGEGYSTRSASGQARGEARIEALRAESMGILKIAGTLGIGTSIVQRVVSAEG